MTKYIDYKQIGNTYYNNLGVMIEAEEGEKLETAKARIVLIKLGHKVRNKFMDFNNIQDIEDTIDRICERKGLDDYDALNRCRVALDLLI